MNPFDSIEEFMEQCVKTRSIPLDFVRSQEFLKLLDKCDYTKEEPYESLHYSRDKKFHISNDRKSMKLYHEHHDVFCCEENSEVKVKPGVKLHLGRGFNDYQYHHVSNSNYGSLKGSKLIALKEHEKRMKGRIDADIITSRHTILDILFSPSGKCKNTIMVKFENQVFMESIDTEERARKIDETSMSGYNLESIVTIGAPGYKLKRFQYTPPKDNAEKYNTLVTHKFPSTNHKVVVSCEVDAAYEEVLKIKGKKDSQSMLKNYIELKSRFTDSPQSRVKPLLQCFLAGTESLIVGIRDKSLFLRKLVKYDVDSELEKAKDLFNSRYLSKWFNFIVLFIEKVIQKLPESNSIQLFKLVRLWKPDRLVLNPMPYNRKSQKLALTPLFVDWRNSMPQNAPGTTDAETHLSVKLDELQLGDD